MAQARPEAPAKRARLKGKAAPHGGGTAAAPAARVVVDKCLEVSLAKGTNTSCLVGISVTGIHICMCIQTYIFLYIYFYTYFFIYIYIFLYIYIYMVPPPPKTQVLGENTVNTSVFSQKTASARAHTFQAHFLHLSHLAANAAAKHCDCVRASLQGSSLETGKNWENLKKMKKLKNQRFRKTWGLPPPPRHVPLNPRFFSFQFFPHPILCWNPRLRCPHPVSRHSSSPVDPAEYPARAARQWSPVSRQSCSPVDPAQYPARAAGQWIPPSIPPERLANGFRRVSCQSGSPVDPAQYPARAARQWIPPSIPPEQLASGSRPISRQSGSPVNPAEPKRLASRSRQYPARAACQWIPPSIPLSIPCRWILPSIRPVSNRSGSPVFASGSRQYPVRAARQSSVAYCPPGG